MSILLLACLPLGCAPAGKEVPLSISCDDFRKENHQVKEVQLAVGDKLIVNLCQQSGSTGYSWTQKAAIGNPQVLEQTNYKTLPPQQSMPGAPSTDVWTFRALQPGSSTVMLEYGQSWQGGQKAGWTLKVNVTVK